MGLLDILLPGRNRQGDRDEKVLQARLRVRRANDRLFEGLDLRVEAVSEDEPFGASEGGRGEETD